MRIDDRARIKDVVDALVERDAGAQGEHLQRGDEAPEIELAAMAERVAFVGRKRGAMDAVEQHPLVAGIDQRMDGLAQHRGASRPPGGAKLYERDQEVADESGVDDAGG